MLISLMDFLFWGAKVHVWCVLWALSYRTIYRICIDSSGYFSIHKDNIIFAVCVRADFFFFFFGFSYSRSNRPNDCHGQCWNQTCLQMQNDSVNMGNSFIRIGRYLEFCAKWALHFPTPNFCLLSFYLFYYTICCYTLQ